MYWTVHLEGGPRRVNHAAAAVDDLIYSFGGYSTGENFNKRRTMDVHVLNTGSLRWRKLPVPSSNDKYVCIKNVPFQRYGHSAVAYGKKIYLWGGRNDESACNKVFCFDTDNGSWSCPRVTGMVPLARDGHSACLIEHRMYIFGGFEEEIDRYSNDVFYLDLQTMKWHYVMTSGESARCRDFHSATAIESRMYVFGGRGDINGPYGSHNEEYYSDIIYLDTKTNKWHRPITTGAIPVGRRSHSAFSWKNCLYIFGGFNGISEEHFNDLHQFNPVTNEWKLVNSLGKPPVRRRRQSCIVINNKAYLFGGTSPWVEVLGEMGPASGSIPEMVLQEFVAEPDVLEGGLIDNQNQNIGDHNNVNHGVVHNPAAFLMLHNHNDFNVQNGVAVAGGNNENLFEGNNYGVEDDEEDDENNGNNDGDDEQQNGAFMHQWVLVDHNEDEIQAKLVDLNDLHVLDFSPSLYTLCLKKVLEHKLDPSGLPQIIRQDLHCWMTPNSISQ